MVKTNASDFVTAGVLLQIHDGVLKLVAYFLKKMTSGKCNYITYNKKLLTVVKSFKAWRPELASVSANQPIKVFTDHKNLKQFITTKQLNCQQARWAEFLSKFNFKINSKPGKEGEKPDVLARHSQDMPKRFDDTHQQHQFQTLLKAD